MRSIVGTLFYWTAGGVALGLAVIFGIEAAIPFQPSAPMCGNTILEPAVFLGGILGFVGGCASLMISH